jgi:hypothetical protein
VIFRVRIKDCLELEVLVPACPTDVNGDGVTMVLGLPVPECAWAKFTLPYRRGSRTTSALGDLVETRHRAVFHSRLIE